jgi:hypothetical protein
VDTVKKYCDELSDMSRNQAMHTFEAVSNWYAEEIMRVIDTCDSKLEKCKAPTHGTRWVELKLTAMRMLARKFNIEKPDVRVNVNIEASKAERDAAAAAIAKSVSMSSQFQLVEPIDKIKNSPAGIVDDCQSTEVVDI